MSLLEHILYYKVCIVCISYIHNPQSHIYSKWNIDPIPCLFTEYGIFVFEESLWFPVGPYDKWTLECGYLIILACEPKVLCRKYFALLLS